jgi:hypothetical protein
MIRGSMTVESSANGGTAVRFSAPLGGGEVENGELERLKK